MGDERRNDSDARVGWAAQKGDVAVSWAGLGWDFSLPRARCPVGRLCGRGCLWAECAGRDLRLPGQCLVCRACPGQKSPSLCPASSGGAAVDTAQALGSHRPGMGPAQI